jgi:hypothetical protein
MKPKPEEIQILRALFKELFQTFTCLFFFFPFFIHSFCVFACPSMKEVIELSDQSSRRDSNDEHLIESQAAPSFGSISNGSSSSLNKATTKIPSQDSPINIPSGDAPVSKKGFLEKIKSKIPPLPLLRIVIKSSTAILIALLFVFETRCRTAMGGAAILVPIGTLLNFPIRTIGMF